ncbi:MAG: anion permease, partial [Opitutae bacterium]|nr:anion permease [Opitutae bacterium]
MNINEKREVHPRRLLCCIAIGTMIWLSPTPVGLDATAWQCFAVFAATIVALLVKPMPMGSSVLCGLVVLAAGNVLGETSKESLAVALSGYGDTTTWLVVSAFLLGSAMVRSGLGRRIAL